MVQQRRTITPVRMKMTKSGIKPSESAKSVRDFIFGNYWIKSNKPEYHIEYPQAEAFNERRVVHVYSDSKTDNDAAIKAANKIVDSIATAMDFLRDQGIELKVIGNNYEVYYEGDRYSIKHLFSPNK